MMARYAKTVAVDLDGVLAEYTEFKGPDTIEKPTAQAEKLLKRLRRKYKVIVFTARNTERVQHWLNDHGLLDLIDGINYCPINGRAGKPVAVAYIDDRAVRWTGNIEKAIAEVDVLAAENVKKDTGVQELPTSERRGVTGTDLIRAISGFNELEPVFEAAMIGDQIVLKAAKDEEFKKISRAIWERGIPL